MFLLPQAADLDVEGAATAAAEGAALASYRFDAYRTGEDPGALETLAIVGGASDASPVAAGVARGTRVAESVALAA